MPAITSITPATFDAGRSVTLSGSGFGTTQGSVLIAGQAQSVTAWTDTAITFTTVRGSQSQGACRVDVVGGVGVTPVFSDGFESGNMATTNAAGFAWDSNNATSIVTMKNDHPSHIGEMWPVVIWNNGSINTAKSSYVDWYAKNGSNSLRFRYAAGANQSEQRFNLGGYYTDMWVRCWLRVPTNFLHPSAAPNNQKLFSLWQDGYDNAGDGATAYWNYIYDGSGGSVVAYSHTTGAYSGATGQTGSTAFIAYPSDQGRWMQLCFRCKVATSQSSNDGLLQLWRRWDGETSWTQIHNATGLDMGPPTSGTHGWHTGYLMGYANATYAAETEFLLDDFTLAEDSLL